MIEGWQKQRLETLIDVRGGKRLPKGEKLLDTPTSYPYIRVTDFENFTVNTSNLKFLTRSIREKIKNYIIRKEDVFISIAGTIGFVGRIPDELDGANLTENAARLVIKNKNIDRDYLVFFLSANHNQYDLLSRMSKNAQPKLSLSNIKSFDLLIPSISEQRNIAYILNTLQKAIEQQDKLIKTTTELKKALMQKLFTEGKKGEKQKQTEIGLVPESWEVVELGKYAFIENGYAFKSEDYVKEGIPLIRISNVSHGFFIDNDNKYLPEQFLGTFSKFALKDGDLIISLTRPVTSGGLKYCFVESKDLPALLNQRVGRFQIKDNKKLSKDFLFHLVFSHYFVGELFKLFGSSSQQPNVSPSQLESFKVPVPDITEQEEIAKILFTLVNKSKLAEQKKRTLADLFKTLLHELMTGQRRVHELEFESLTKEYAIEQEPLSMVAE